MIGALALIMTGGAAQAEAVAALPAASQPVAQIGMAKQIMGWVRFCQQNRAECAVDVSEPTTIELTSSEWQTIVNRHSA